MTIQKKYLTEVMINEVLRAREQKNQKGMVLSHNVKTNKLEKFRIRY